MAQDIIRKKEDVLPWIMDLIGRPNPERVPNQAHQFVNNLSSGSTPVRALSLPWNDYILQQGNKVYSSLTPDTPPRITNFRDGSDKSSTTGYIHQAGGDYGDVKQYAISPIGIGENPYLMGEDIPVLTRALLNLSGNRLHPDHVENVVNNNYINWLSRTQADGSMRNQGIPEMTGNRFGLSHRFGSDTIDRYDDFTGIIFAEASPHSQLVQPINAVRGGTQIVSHPGELIYGSQRISNELYPRYGIQHWNEMIIPRVNQSDLPADWWNGINRLGEYQR